MRALIEGLVYLLVALLYLLVEVIRALASVVRPSRSEPRRASAPEPARQARARVRGQPTTGPPRARKASGARGRWQPERGSKIAQMSLFRADPPSAERRTLAAGPTTRSRGRDRGPPPTAAPPRAGPAASPAAHPGSTREEPRRFDSQARWAGKLVDRGVGQFADTKRPGRNGEPARYSSYYVTLETEEGAIVTKQGVELQKALELSGAEIGDAIELLLLGKEAVTVTEDGKTAARHRNKWRINRRQENQWHQ